MPLGETQCEGRGCWRTVLALENPYCDECWRRKVQDAAASQQAANRYAPEVQDPFTRHRRKV